MSAVGTVSRLHRFPVKSMQGETIAGAAFDENGMAGDRTWALRDAETGKIVSAKRPRLWRTVLDCRATGTGDEVVVTVPSGSAFGIGDPDLLVALAELLGRQVAVDSATGPGQGTYESDWPELEGISLAGEIDLPVNLLGQGTSFIDMGIVHLVTTASLAALAELAPGTAADPQRFRPTFLVDTPGLVGFAENDWQGATLRVGETELLVGRPTPRCVMTTVEQGDLPADRAGLQALAANNRVTDDLGSFACLGVYASVTSPGTIRVGDVVELV